MSSIFITGATGQIGAFVAKELLQRGYHLTLLVRGENPHSRIENVFAKIGITSHNYDVVQGNILDANVVTPKQKISHFLHCAADLSFEERHRDAILETNVTGTRNMLRWCKNWSCSRFHYVSTAYVAGRYKQPFNETMLDERQEFNNEYERSKMLAEKMCHEFATNHNLILKIYRPGIVMGEKIGTSVNYSGFYVLLKLLDKISQWDKKKSCEKIRIKAKVDVQKHLVGVDYVACSIVDTIANNNTQTETLFLLPQKALSAQQLLSILQKQFDLPLLVIREDNFVTENSLERLIQRSIEIYAAYLEAEPLFDATYSHEKLKNPTQLNEQYFHNMICYGQSDNWGIKKSKRIQTQHHYFTSFLATFVGRRLIDDVKSITCCFGVCLEQNITCIHIKKGVLVSITKKTKYPLDFTYQVSTEIFNQMIQGKTDPRMAFFNGKTDIVGDIEQGLKIANLLRIFFRNHPFQLKTTEEQNVKALA